jgi:hypothetical protein
LGSLRLTPHSAARSPVVRRTKFYLCVRRACPEQERGCARQESSSHDSTLSDVE